MLAVTLPISQIDSQTSGSRGKWLFSVFASAQILIIVLSLLSNYAPSYLQGEILNWLSPYVVSTHQLYGAKPLELTHSEDIDFPVHIDVQYEGDNRWSSVQFKTQDLQKTRWPMFARIFAVVVSEDSENEVLSEITLAIVRKVDSLQRKKIRRIRLYQPHVFSFDEDSYVNAGQADLLDGLTDDTQLFAADVVYDSSSNIIGVLPILSEYRTSPAARQL